MIEQWDIELMTEVKCLSQCDTIKLQYVIMQDQL